MLSGMATMLNMIASSSALGVAMVIENEGGYVENKTARAGRAAVDFIQASSSKNLHTIARFASSHFGTGPAAPRDGRTWVHRRGGPRDQQPPENKGKW